MKSIILSLTALIFTLNIYSQRNDVLINPYWYFYSNNHLDAVSSGMGSTGIGSVGDLSSSSMNPASFEIENKYQVSLQYTYKTNQPWLQQLGLDEFYLKQNIFSGLAGFGYKVNKNFNVGLIYSNPNSMDINIGDVIITNEFGVELGRYEAVDRYSSHNFSVPLSYKFKNIRVGISLNYTLHRRYFNTQYENFVIKYDRFNADAGILVDIVEGLSFGLKFRPEAKGEAKYFSDINPQFDDYTDVILPMQIGTGISYTLKNKLLRFAADYNYVNGSKLVGLKDQHSVHFGLEYNVNKNWQVRTGFFTQPDPRDLTTNYLNPQDSYDQIFLTFGGSYKIKNALISLAVMDSHISSCVLKYTFINGGVNLNF